MARPTHLTDAIERRIVGDIRKGAHLRQAARSAGVPESTLAGWLTNPGARYEGFRDAILEAEAEAEIEAVSEVRGTDKRWWLERRHPERWGRPTESRAQAAAVLQVGMAPEAGAAPSEDGVIYFTPEELRVASRAFLNQKRVMRGEPPLLEDPAVALRGLIVDGSDEDS